MTVNALDQTNTPIMYVNKDIINKDTINKDFI